jgi:hypothetical protein
MKKIFTLLMIFLSFSLCNQAIAQVEDDDDDEDFSQYDDFGLTEGDVVRRYAAPKILGLAPAKLISIGYDVQGPNSLNEGNFAGEGFAGETRFAATHGLRFFFNLPVISNNKLLVNIGGNHFQTNYVLASGETANDPLAKVLSTNGLRNSGLNTTIFKPISESKFLLFFGQAEMSGDRYINQNAFNTLRYSWVGVYGWRPHDRLQYGFGVTQSYRAGEVNYFPIVMYNYTSQNKKWGIEALLPARAHFRRTFNSRNIMLAGFELEGTSYRLNTASERGFPSTLAINNGYDPNMVELRRSEIRPRIAYERGLNDFIWLSAQVGYVVNYRFDVDSGDFFRGFFGNQDYVMQNKLSNPLYFNISINLVSP